MVKWMEFYKRIKHGKTFDKENERLENLKNIGIICLRD